MLEEEEFKEVFIEGLKDDEGVFQKAVIRDILIDIPLNLFDGYGMYYGTKYGYRL